MASEIDVVNITEIKYDEEKEELTITADGYNGPFPFTKGRIKFNVPKDELNSVHEKIQIGSTKQTIKGVLVIKT